MPSDRRTRRILRNHGLRQILGRHASDRSSSPANVEQKIRNRQLALALLLGIDVIVDTKASYPPLGEITVVVVSFKFKSVKDLQQVRLFRFA